MVLPALGPCAAVFLVYPVLRRRPALKGVIKALQSNLQSAERLFTLAKALAPSSFAAATWLPPLVAGRQAAAGLLHHDAITGTSADYVVQWYTEYALDANAGLDAVVAASVAALSGAQPGDPPLAVVNASTLLPPVTGGAMTTGTVSDVAKWDLLQGCLFVRKRRAGSPIPRTCLLLESMNESHACLFRVRCVSFAWGPCRALLQWWL